MNRPALKRLRDESSSSSGSNPDDDQPEMKTEEDYFAYVERCYTDWYDLRYPFEPNWYLDVAFYLGLQYHVWNEPDRALVQPRAPSFRQRMVVNKIYPAIRTLMGKFLRGVPSIITAPTLTSDKARSDARVSSRLLRGLWPHLHMYYAQQELLLWGLITGSGFAKVGWDPSLGDWSVDAEGRPMRTGDMTVEPLSPYALLVPGHQKNLWDPSKVMQCGVYDENIVRNRFPDLKDIRGFTGSGQQSLFEERLATLVSPIGINLIRSGSTQGKSVFVKELWEDPQTLTPREQEEFPTGRLIITVNKKVAYVGKNPFSDARHPYVMFRGGVMPGRFWGMSHIDQVIPIQRSYNKSESQTIEARNLATQPQLLVQKGSGVGKLTNEPGSFLEYKEGFQKPEFLQPPQMSQWMAESRESLAAHFEDIMQIRAASKGEPPSANISGVGINLLQDADNTPWGPMAQEYALALGEIGQKILNRAAQGYIEPRQLTILEDLDQEDVMEFFSDGELLPVRVTCDVTSVMPFTTAARQARVESMLSLHVLDPIQDRSKVLRLMEFPSEEELFLRTDDDYRRAGRENKAMQRGVPAQVKSFDDHGVHVATHGQLQKSTEYEALPPEQQAMIDQHVALHLQQLAMQRAAMAPPGPPGGGPPSGGAGTPSPAGPGGGPPSGGMG